MNVLNYIFQAIKGIFGLVVLPYLVTQTQKTVQRKANAELFSDVAYDVVQSFIQRYPTSNVTNYLSQMISEFRTATGCKDVDVAERVILSLIHELTKK